MKFSDIFRRKPKKIGLALSSGAAKGLSHIGVIKAMKEDNVRVDMVSGASIGAIVGACYAKTGDVDHLEKVVNETDLMKLFKLVDLNLALMFKGFIHGNKVKELLSDLIGDINFNDLKIPLKIVATEVNTGTEVIIGEGSVVEAVRASISLPGIFTPVRVGKKFVMDGGVANPVPVNVVREMGSDYVIACNVFHSAGERKKARSKRKKSGHEEKSQKKNGEGKSEKTNNLNERIEAFISEGQSIIKNFSEYIDAFKKKEPKKFKDVEEEMPDIFDVLMQSVYTMEYEVSKMRIKDADLVISPEVMDIEIVEFNRGKEAIKRGYETAKEVLEKHRFLTR